MYYCLWVLLGFICGGVYCFLFGFCQCTCISFQFHMSPFHWFMCMYISARGNKVRLYRINSINVNNKYWYKNTRKTYLIWVFTLTDWQLVNANGEYIYICELSTITITTTRKYTEIMIVYMFYYLDHTIDGWLNWQVTTMRKSV